MIKTEMMKKYEAETGDNSQIVWHGGSFASDDYIAWLEAQLTWRPVSEEPEHGNHFTLEGGPMDFAEIEQRYAGMVSKKKHKCVKPIDPDTRRDMIMHDLDFGMRYGTNSPQELENMSYALGVRYGHNTAIRRAHMQHMCDMLTKLEEDFND